VKKLVIFPMILLLLTPGALFAEERKPLIDMTAFNDYIRGPEGYQVLSTTHDILGYGAVLLGLVSGLMSPPLLDVDEDIHGFIGGTAAVAAVLNLGVGLLNYGDRFDTSEGLFTIDNIHIVMGITGGILMLVGSLTGESDAHPWISGLATGLMGISIILQM